MIKWFVYIAILWILIPCLSFAKTGRTNGNGASIYHISRLHFDSAAQAVADTTPYKTKQQKQQETDDKKKIKEVAKAKHVPKPEKVDEGNAEQKPKPKRQRRPPGMERPPEIPRHNGN
jgi:hypothetical protein